MNYEQIKIDLRNLPVRNTKSVDMYNKKLIKLNTDVSYLREHVLTDQSVYRTYFQVSLGVMKNYLEQISFIEYNKELLKDWWHVDVLLQFIKKPLPFEYVYEKAKQYVTSSLPFVRRFGYVIFLLDLQKDGNNFSKIFELLKDDDEFYVQMAEGWLLADMAVFDFEKVYYFLSVSKIKYNILGKAIQKIVDSFRITEENKNRVKMLRSRLKDN